MIKKKSGNHITELHRTKRIDEDAWKEWRHKRDEYNKKCTKAASECWKKDMAEFENISEAARLQKLLENRSAKKLRTLKKSDGVSTPEVAKKIIMNS